MTITKVRNYIGVLTLILGVLNINSAWADRYIITFKDANTFKQLKQLPNHKSKSSFGFMSATANVDKTLDNLNMIVVTSKEDITHLSDNPHILAVEKEELFPLPKQVATFSGSSDQNLNNILNDQIERPWGIDAVNAPGAWSTTQGEGATVLVIDTGLDRDHPALKERFIDGKNFYGRSDDAPYEYFDTVGHGTHVAGTILADGLNGGLEGVAPQAKLYAGRVCGTFGCSPIAIAEAINWGIDKKVSVMNLSLGGARISRTERLAYERAEELGVSIVAASGNDSTGKISCPACIDTVIAVGAVSEDLNRAEFSQYGEGLFIMAPGVNVVSAVPMGTGRQSETQIDLGNGFEVVASQSFQGATALDDAVNGELVYVGLGTKDDFEGVDLTDKVALIQRGEITFKDKVDGAIAVGAKAVVIFNNVDGLTGGAITQDGSEIGVPVVMIEQILGEQILSQINEKDERPQASLVIHKTNYGGQQGTSMASPHVAGVVALIRAANPDLSPAQVRDIIKATATDIGNANEYGNGLIDAEKAVVKAFTTLGEMVLVAN